MIDPQLFRMMAEQVQDYGVFLLDPEGRVMSWNAGAQRIKGYAAEEIVGRHFSVFYPADAVARGWPQHELEVATREGRFEDEGYRVRKDGSRFWANVVITALRDEDGRLVAFSKITRDLSARRLEQEALLQSEERFRLLVEGVVDYAIYMLDPEGRVTSWNSGAERINGYSRDEVLGRHFSNFFLPEDVHAGRPWEELARARREGRVEVEGWRLRKNGERFWARAVLTPLHDAKGKLRGYAKVTQDLSQRRQIEQLETSARKVNEFIGVLAHEIRNPLAPLATALDVMERAGTDEALQVEMRRIIERQAKRLERIAADMSDISRITRGALSIERSPVELRELIERSIEVSTPWIEAAAQRLEVDFPAEPVVVDGDLQRLIQVFANLLNNAARYTPSGGRIWIRARREGREAVVSVQDTGRGIAPESLPSIFQMFVQGRPPLERAGEGLGVGLALARSIVELHGGRIEARSEGEGKGAEFEVRLPLAAAAAHEAPGGAAEPAATASPAARRILVVDDNVDAALTLRTLLASLGHETRVAHDGPEALAAFDEFRPDLVLLDIGLPGMNGYEVARRLRQRRQGVRIVAITGWGQEDDRRQSAEAGFDLHLVKPVDERQLSEALEAARPGRTLH